MKLVYSRRALADLTGIATYYSINASQAIAESIERRFIESRIASVVRRSLRRASSSAPE